jgi:predicted Zn-dependent peptidase
LAALPALIMGYHIPPIGTADYYPLSILALALADGDSSRLYRRLVYENNWITGLFAGPNQYIGPQLFRIWFQIQADIETDRVLNAFDTEMERILNQGITDDELEKAQNQLIHRFASRLSTVSQVGDYLAHAASTLQNAYAVNTELEKYLSVSRKEIREVVCNYFDPSNRSLITVRPEGKV